jgi:hypothetical protein
MGWIIAQLLGQNPLPSMKSVACFPEIVHLSFALSGKHISDAALLIF